MISVWCFTVISVLQTDAWMKDFVLAVTHLRQRMGLCLRRNMDPGNMSRNSEDPFWHGIISANNNFCWMSYFLQSFCAKRKGQWNFQLIATLPVSGERNRTRETRAPPWPRWAQPHRSTPSVPRRSKRGRGLAVEMSTLRKCWNSTGRSYGFRIGPLSGSQRPM